MISRNKNGICGNAIQPPVAIIISIARKQCNHNKNGQSTTVDHSRSKFVLCLQPWQSPVSSGAVAEACGVAKVCAFMWDHLLLP